MSITTNLKGAREKRFEYDRVFQPRESQSAVYKEVSPMVQSSMDGFHSCIFAYGQTGSGKTYTMQGPANDPGVYTRSLEELFKIKEQRKATHEYTLTVSMVEIYNESIRDLLIPTDSAPNNNVLEIRKSKEGGNYLPNANLMNVESQEDIVKMMKIGEHNRSVGATKANEHSSRSHCLLLITIVGEEIESGAKMNGKLHKSVYLKNFTFKNSDVFTVPSNHYFFLGDNRDCSKDSRYLTSVGYVHQDNLVGKARFVFFSSDRSVGSMFAFWKWNKSIRFDRFFKNII